MRRRAIIFGVAMLLGGCMGSNERWYEQGEGPDTAWEKAGLTFVQQLMKRRYDDAHAMLTREFGRTTSEQDLERAMRQLTSEKIRPMDDPWVLSSLRYWQAKERADQGMAYVQIGGDGNEAIMVTVAEEDDQFRIRAIEWGRP